MSNARDKANIPSLNFSSTGIDDNATSTAITIDSFERVGILQTSPNSNLHVSSGGNTKVRFDGNTNSNTSTFLISHLSSGDVGLQFNSNQLNMFSYGDIAFYPSTSNISGSYPNGEVMRIRNNGNVGIGTSSPSQELEVVGEVLANNFRLPDTGGTISGSRSVTGSALQLFDTTQNIRAWTAGSERMRINSSGYVGIGTTTPDRPLTVKEVSNVAISVIKSSGEDILHIGEYGGGGDATYNSIYNGSHIFLDNGTERMRINSSGQITVGGATADGKFAIASNAGSLSRLISLKDTGNAGGGRDYIEFFNNSGGSAGSIEHNGTSTVAYITSSDYRLKENVSYDFDATTRLKQLKPARFNFIGETDRTVDGFLAHEVSDIVPEAISGEKDALQVWKEGEELPEGVSVGDNKLDENGNTIMQIQGIDQSKLVPLLVKTIQELEARITALENQP